MIRKIEIERFTLSSSKPFDEVVAALNSAVGHPDMAEFWKSTHRAQSDAELQNTIEKGLGRTGLMLFAEFERRLGRAIAESPLAATCKSARVTPLQLAQTAHCMRTRVEVPHGLADRVRGQMQLAVRLFNLTEKTK